MKNDALEETNLELIKAKKEIDTLKLVLHDSVLPKHFWENIDLKKEKLESLRNVVKKKNICILMKCFDLIKIRSLDTVNSIDTEL